MKHLLVVILSLVIASPFALAQQQKYSSANKKAIAMFNEGIKFYDAKRSDEAKRNFEKAIEKDPKFIEAYVMLAYVYQDMREKEKAVVQLQKALKINSEMFPEVYFTLGSIEISLGRYEDCKMHLQKFTTFAGINEEYKKLAQRDIQNCDFAIAAIRNPVPFDPVNMGDAINSPDYEYFPSITGDDQTFIFTRNVRSSKGDQQEDFYVTTKADGKWTKAVSIGPPINTDDNEGAPSISADGQLLVFAACNRQDGYGRCDIYFSRRIGDRWTKPKNIGPPVNTKYRETQPTFSSDGKTLYFLSDRPGGFGKHDIWMSVFDETKGNFSDPVNLGPNVNSAGDEVSPFIHPDNQTLYYASNGLVGMGGLDIYMVKKDAVGNWGSPVNLGYPINTWNDENSLLVSSAGDEAFFSSDRKGGLGGLDIYSFKLPENLRPEKLTYVKGRVVDSLSRKPLEASFELIDIQTGKTVAISTSNSANGEFLLTIPAGKDYALNVSKSGYLFYSQHFSLKNADVSKPFLLDIPVQKAEEGATAVLNNVFFDFNKWELKPESKAELDKLVKFMNDNETLKIEVSGHTDNVGAKPFNQLLSQNRAKAVYDYLIIHGIKKDRLSYKGYGDTKPLCPGNGSDECRAKNRRTEFKITAK